MVTNSESTVVIGAMKVHELAKNGGCFGKKASAGEDVEEERVGKGMRAVVRVLCGELEEGEAGRGVMTEMAEEGVGEVVGEFEGEILDGLRTVEDEKAGDSVEELWLWEVCCFFSKLPLERKRRVKESIMCGCENEFFERRTKHLRSITCLVRMGRSCMFH